eukprot:1388913-Prymnesium_polylepis.1
MRARAESAKANTCGSSRSDQRSLSSSELSSPRSLRSLRCRSLTACWSRRAASTAARAPPAALGIANDCRCNLALALSGRFRRRSALSSSIYGVPLRVWGGTQP